MSPIELIERQIKMDIHLWESLERVAQDVGIKDSRGNHSQLIREMLSAAVIRWLQSPYVCHAADYLVLVTREGHVFFRQVQTLKLNKDRERLPCFLEMKPEKRRDFFASKEPGMDEAEWFKSRWLINYFGVWLGEDIERKKPLRDWVDHNGIDAKQVDLLVSQDAGAILTREIVVGARDYVQRREPQARHEYDRVGFPIDIPTRNMTALVVVDLDLYGSSRPPDLELEFRNREWARFESEGISHDYWNPMGATSMGRHLKKEPSPKSKEILKELDRFKKRVETLAKSQVEDDSVVPPEQLAELNSVLRIPADFLYYKLSWPSPYFGIEVCVRWQKPEKER